MNSRKSRLTICITTVSTKEEARRLAHAAIETRKAGCSQIEGPIESLYNWEDSLQTESEYRVLFKCLSSAEPELSTLIHSIHPYDTPQWVAIEADKVSEKYLKWIEETSNFHGFPN